MTNQTPNSSPEKNEQPSESTSKFNLQNFIQNNLVLFICSVAVSAFGLGWVAHEEIEQSSGGKPLIKINFCKFNAQGKIDRILYKNEKEEDIDMIVKKQDIVEVGQDIVVQGEIDTKNMEGHHLWLVVNREGSSDWHPQIGEIVTKQGKAEWQQNAQIGLTDADIGNKFTIALVEVDKKGNAHFISNLKSESSTKLLPNDHSILDTITVTRK